MAFEIYQIRNTVFGKSYIGLTTIGVENRWIQHRAFTRRGYERGHPLYTDMADLGLDAFLVECIACCHSEKDLRYLERELIADRNTLAPNGYNLSHGGESINMTSGIPISYGGRDFSSHKELAREFLVPYEVMKNRIKSGWSMEQSLGNEPPPYNSPNAIPIEVDGIEYNSISEAIHALRKNASTVYTRLKNNKTIEEAFGFEPLFHPLYQRVGIDDDHIFKSIREASIYYGVPYALVKDRLRGNRRNKKTQWSVRQALGLDTPPERPLPPKNNWVEIEYDGKVFPSNNHLARHLRIDIQLFTKRLAMGLSIDEIIKIPVRQGYKPDGSPIAFSYKIVNFEDPSESFLSITEFANFLGIKTAQAKRFLDKKYPFFGKKYCYENVRDEYRVNLEKVPKICGCVLELSSGRVFPDAALAGTALGITNTGITNHCNGKYKTQKFGYVCEMLSVDHKPVRNPA